MNRGQTAYRRRPRQARESKTLRKAVRAVLASVLCLRLPLRANYLEVDHHARVLVLEDVAVEQVELLSVEVVGELYGYPHRLPGPDEDGVFPSQVSSGSALVVYPRLGDLAGAVSPLEHPEPEAVEVHGVWHAARSVAGLPDL